MPNNQEIAFDFTVEGVNDSVAPALLKRSALARMVNCRIYKQLPTTRYGFKAHKLGADANEFRSLNIQGAVFYNPAQGQSQQSFGPDQSSIVASAGGKRFHISFGATDIVSVSDETNDHPGVADVHLAWMFQAENYLIVQDGISDTWIWDGVAGAFLSPGYNDEEPENSRLANSATVGAYAHGRILQVIDGKKILVGDILHKQNLSSPRNILETTEQIYFATGSFFSPPSNMGEVVAAGILPLRNTQHGHDDVLIHCKYGVYSLKLDHYPRSQWSELAISKHLLLDTAAVGPYALVLYDGDQMFRSRNGIQTIRSAAANTDVVGNPQQAISEPIKSMMDADYTPFLRFCSMAKWQKENRVFCTTGMWLDGAHRGGRGIVSLNVNPLGSYASNARAWEGLWTLPYGFSRPIHMINGMFGEKDRFLLLCTEKVEDDYNNSLVEMLDGSCHDLLEDGTSVAISAQVISRMLPQEDIVSYKKFINGRIIFTNVTGSLEFGVWVRPAEHAPWTLWTTKSHCADECSGADCITGDAPRRLVVNLGDAPAIEAATQLQALVRWRGCASLEVLRVGFDLTDSDDTPGEPCVSQSGSQMHCDFDDYEYSSKQPTWTV